MTTYNVYRDGKKVASGLEVKSYTDTELTPNTEYTYQVSAENSAGESELSGSIKVTTDYSPVASVAVSPKTNNLEVGATRQLNATVEPSTAKQDVTWSSDDEAIATVDSSGKVTAVAKGQATITATAKDDESINDTSTVTIKQPVTGVTISPKTAEVEVEATIKLSSTVNPDNADNKKVTYKSSDEKIATVANDGTVTGVAEGAAEITVTTTDGNKTDKATVTVVPKPEPEPEPDPEEPPEEGTGDGEE